MRDGEPCPDCQWTTYLLTGRPVVFLRCDACRNWFHCNVSVKKPGTSIVGRVTVVEVSINQTCTKDMLNSLLRCDCMAKQTFLSHVAHCDPCKYKNSRLVAPTPIRHSLRLLPRDTLHSFIMRMTRREYQRSSLPAYTLQRRCGAVEDYFQRYVQEIATEAQSLKVLAYRKKRMEIRNAHEDQSASRLEHE